MWQLHLLVLAIGIGGIDAHMQLANPYPIRSPLDTTNANNTFDDYLSPLKSDASDYPCKGLISGGASSNSSTTMTATTQHYHAGNEYTASLAGGATHGGGSCQFSLSYDGGETFKVIKSIIGSCPTQLSYRFRVPADAPAGEALFAWTWFNRLGNQEMYMNCANVNISAAADWAITSATTSPTTSTEPSDVPAASSSVNNGTDIIGTTRRRAARYLQRRQQPQTQPVVPFDDLPSLFLANINTAPAQCETIEGRTVVFFDPGPSIEYGDDWEATGELGYTCTSSSNSSSFSSSSSSLSPSAETAATEPRSTLSTLSTFYASRSVAGNQSTSDGAPVSSSLEQKNLQALLSDMVSAVTATASSSSSQVTGDPCVVGTIRCDSTSTYSLCTVQGRYISMGKVTEGAVCKDGQIHFGGAS